MCDERQGDLTMLSCFCNVIVAACLECASSAGEANGIWVFHSDQQLASNAQMAIRMKDLEDPHFLTGPRH